MTPGQVNALKNLWPKFGLDAGSEQLDLDRVFQRNVPKVLEIGFGNGESLLTAAAQRPELDFLGIEVHEPGIGHCMLGAETADLSNLRIIAGDAVEVLKQNIADSSLSRINLLFPDPWPKKRHHKRRIVQHAFFALAAGKLATDGSLYIATDWENYAEHIDEVIAQSPCFKVAEKSVHTGNAPLDRENTKFEIRGLKKGHRISDWHLIRI